jgi:hypothetical protein
LIDKNKDTSKKPLLLTASFCLSEKVQIILEGFNVIGPLLPVLISKINLFCSKKPETVALLLKEKIRGCLAGKE